MDEATANLLAELKLAGMDLNEADLIKAGVIHPGTLPSAGFGMPTLPPARVPRPGDPRLPPRHDDRDEPAVSTGWTVWTAPGQLACWSMAPLGWTFN